MSVDLATQTLGGTEYTATVEQTWHMREIGGKLYVPYPDPQGDNTVPSNGQLAIASAPGSWSLVTTALGLTHGFDFTITADGWWLCGSDEVYDEATIWRSTDEGATWTKSLEVGADPDSTPLFARFYALATFGDDILAFYRDADVQAWRWSSGGTEWTQLDTLPWDGTAGITETLCPFSYNEQDFWIGGYNCLDAAKVQPFIPQIITLPGSGADGAAIRASLPSAIAINPILDATTAGGDLWVLTSDWHVWRGTTTGTWTDLGLLDDTTAQCLAVDTTGWWLYFGTSDSRILRAAIPA